VSTMPQWPKRSTMLEPVPVDAWRQEAKYQGERADAAMAIQRGVADERRVVRV
jgi:hypothetical protein